MFTDMEHQSASRVSEELHLADPEPGHDADLVFPPKRETSSTERSTEHWGSVVRIDSSEGNKGDGHVDD